MAEPTSMVHFMLMLMFLLTGGQGDLLDQVPTDAYWQAKHVEVTPEVMLAELAAKTEALDLKRQIENLGSEHEKVRELAGQEIIKAGSAAEPQLRAALEKATGQQLDSINEVLGTLEQSSHAAAVRRLMAIRTLGELKSPEATEALSALAMAKTKDPWTNFYATRALGAIKGLKTPHASTAEQLTADVGVLPEDAGIIAQYRLSDMENTSLDEVLKVSGQRINDPKAAKAKLASKLIEAVEQFGNARVDTLTLAISKDLGPRGGYVAIVAHGQFDTEAVGTLFQKNGFLLMPVNEVPAYKQGPATFLIPSSDRVAFVVQEGAADVQEKLAGAIKGGKAMEHKDLAKMLDEVDRSGPVWGVGTIPPEMAALLPQLQAIESLQLSSKIEEGKVKLAMEGAGSDPEAIKGALAGIDPMWQMMMNEITQEAGRQPGLTPLIETLKTIKFTADDKTLKATGELRDLSVARIVLPLMLSEMQYALLRDDQPGQIAPQTEEMEDLDDRQ